MAGKARPVPIKIEALRRGVTNARIAFTPVEDWLVDNEKSLTEANAMRLAEAVIITRTGFRLLKKVLRSHGAAAKGAKP